MIKHRIGRLAIVAVVGLSTGADLFACGDKFLVLGRGTRYQRPKTARAASVLIYADPASNLPATLKSIKADTALKHEGHRATTVASADELSTILASGRFDVVLAAGSAAPGVEKIVGMSPDRAIVVGVDQRAKAGSLLEAIDKAVERHDQNIKKAHS
jgi:hypothetical protein